MKNNGKKDTKIKRYRIEVMSHGEPGYYEAPTLFSLLLTRFIHQLNHFLESGRWID